MIASKKVLRPMTSGDIDLVLGWRNHPTVSRYMYTQRLITVQEHREWFERASQCCQRHLLIYEQDMTPVGFVNIKVVDEQARRAEWGFYLAPDAPPGSGQNLGQSALVYAFETLSLHKLCGEVLADNSRSVRFHERHGFHREARLRDHFYNNGNFYDVIGFGLLAEEWHHSKEQNLDD